MSSGSNEGDGGQVHATGGRASSGGTGGTATAEPPTSNGIPIDGNPENYRVVRLTHQQWENAIRDLLALAEPLGLANNFIPDPPNGTFSNDERSLYVTDGLRLDYQRAAEEAAEGLVQEGAPKRWGASPSEVIETLGHRAFRRPLEREEAARYQALWADGAYFFESGDEFADGMRVFVEALLQSPHFLYRLELTPRGERLSGNELATKLSFLLKDTIPDDELLAAAQEGELDTPDGLAAVAEQLLEDDSVVEVVEGFYDELFGLSRYRSILKSKQTFPSYKEELNQMLYDADVMFFSHLYRQNGGIRSVLTSPVAYVNDDIAPFYDVSAVGSGFTEVELDESRPGYLTRVGFLAYNANLSDPDPIHRGVDISNRLLCAELSPPPGEIPPLPAAVPGQTNRERVTAHTGTGFCGNCHMSVINPPGFALEGFDAMGQARTMDNEKPVDTSGSYSLLETEEEFEGIVDLAQMLSESERVHSCYSSHVLMYALARDLGKDDVDLLESLTDDSVERDASLKDLLLAAVTSERFTTASYPEP